ncbi:MFS transporter [Chloroflexota bacterium]
MGRVLRWYDYVAINIQWLGLNTATGTITPLLLPFLVALFVPPDRKNTYLATVRVISLAVAMAVQPTAGLLCDRSTLSWGRRRPYIVAGSAGSLLFLVAIGTSSLWLGTDLGRWLQPLAGVSAAYAVLLVGIVLWQASSNVSQGALQGLIPDLVPTDQRGRASGVKSVMELLPVLVIIFIGPLLDAGEIVLILAIVAGVLILTTLITTLSVHEEPLREKPDGIIRSQVRRLVGLAAIFVGITQAGIWLIRQGTRLLTAWDATTSVQVVVIGLFGLAGMVGAIVAGVHLGIRVGIGPEYRRHRSFVWWVTNRLLFLAAVGSIQGFMLYYVGDVHNVSNAGALTTTVLVAVAAFLVPSALAGGYLSDRVGRRRLVALAGLVAALGALLLILARSVPALIVSASALGGATGLFMSTNWALGTDLVPAGEAGKYLGISNLAGAGAGIVGVGIGGPMADSFNLLRPGLGYLVVFGVYGLLFLLSAVALTQVVPPQGSTQRGVAPA